MVSFKIDNKLHVFRLLDPTYEATEMSTGQVPHSIYTELAHPVYTEIAI